MPSPAHRHPFTSSSSHLLESFYGKLRVHLQHGDRLCLGQEGEWNVWTSSRVFDVVEIQEGCSFDAAGGTGTDKVFHWDTGVDESQSGRVDAGTSGGNEMMHCDVMIG